MVEVRAIPISGRKLITQNLLTSAATIEWDNAPDWEAVEDFSALVDLFCLYDKTVVLGRGIGMQLRNRDSELFSALNSADFVDVEEITGTRAEKVSDCANRHLITFLGSNDTGQYRELVERSLSPQNAAYALTYVPDRQEEVYHAFHALPQLKSKDDVLHLLDQEQISARRATFLVRTFLYLAFSDVEAIPLRPDVTRVPVLDKLLNEEKSFRIQLLESLDKTWRKEGVFGDSELQRHISPLAAVVLERAYPSRKQIIPKLKELRLELADTRERLWRDENIALWGTDMERRKAEQRWQDRLNEIELTFGEGVGLLNVRRAVNYGETLGKIADKPTSYAAWAQAILTLPIEITQRVLSRLPVIEVHRVMKERPAAMRLRSAVNRLFGSAH